MRNLITILLSIAFLTGCSSLSQERLKVDDVVSLEVGGGLPSSHSNYSKPFHQDDPEGKTVISKLVGWLNASEVTEGQTEYGKHGYPDVLEFKLKNGKTAIVEPAYNCETNRTEDGGSLKRCEPVRGEIVLSIDDKKVRLKSAQVYDWLQGGWKEDSPTVAGNRIIINEVIWKNHSYFLGETLSTDQIGKQIGIVDDSRMINCSECKAPPIVKGDKVYEIKGVDTQETIAVENGVDIYYRLNSHQR